MQRKILSLEMLTERQIYNAAVKGGEDNTDTRMRMKKLLSAGINCELTGRQKYCVCEYYTAGKTMKQIAGELGVVPSTVTRHIKAGVKILKKLSYYV